MGTSHLHSASQSSFHLAVIQRLTLVLQSSSTNENHQLPDLAISLCKHYHILAFGLFSLPTPRFQHSFSFSSK